MSGEAAIAIRRLSGDALQQRLDDLARLRIAVFRAFPYLYDGDADYERGYLAAYARSPGAVVVGAFAGPRMVGAATAAPLADHFDAFARPLAAAGLDPRRLFYFGESVLEPAWRGRGIGVRFFEERERAAREQGFDQALFSAVVRPADHPLRPDGYVPLDAFWRRRGYARVPGLQTHFAWKDVDQPGETEKPMEYWLKRLD